MADKAMDLLSWMEERMEPSLFSYTSVLSALAKEGLAERAELLVLRMKERNVHPDNFTMNTVIDAWARSNEPDKAPRAMSILRSMIQSLQEGDVSLKPDKVSFSAVMKACGRTRASSEKKKQVALQMTMETFRMLQQGLFDDIDDSAYASCLWAIQQLAETESQKAQLMMSVFRDCQQQGYVSHRVMESMGSLRPDRLHPAWSRNIGKNNPPKR